jgi:hypothetical protein
MNNSTEKSVSDPVRAGSRPYPVAPAARAKIPRVPPRLSWVALLRHRP